MAVDQDPALATWLIAMCAACVLLYDGRNGPNRCLRLLKMCFEDGAIEDALLGALRQLPDSLLGDCDLGDDSDFTDWLNDFSCAEQVEHTRRLIAFPITREQTLGTLTGTVFKMNGMPERPPRYDVYASLLPPTRVFFV